MTKTRLEAFSDGVIAILITIMVLELKVPEEKPDDTIHMLVERGPIFFAYVLSFVFVGIYWANHHHLVHTVQRVTGGILWANLHLLFWLSLIPFTTHWMGGTSFAPVPTAIYGAVMIACAFAWLILQTLIIRVHGPDSALKQAVGDDWKGKVSLLSYGAAILLALYVNQYLALAVYVLVALMWLIPDRRIETRLRQEKPES